MGKKGYLILENGKIFEGVSFGSVSDRNGEVVFNTGMVGYPEGITDPSYFGQILVTTYPLIGNYGVPDDAVDNMGIKTNFESDRIQIRGLIVSCYMDYKKHWQAKRTLSDWLISQNIPALQGIDTRTLTKMLRQKGVMKGAIKFGPPPSRHTSGLFLKNVKDINEENLVQEVSCRKPLFYGKGSLKILLIDCGVKNNIIRNLVSRNLSVVRVPWDFDPYRNNGVSGFDAVVVSNGPGDPKMAIKTIGTVQKLLSEKIPFLGICLGNQILALAIGADTYKLKYGHRGQNQPVRDCFTGKCFVTTQNHGFTVDGSSLPSGWHPWFINLNDNTNEGIRHEKLPFISIQFHPEATPGPLDTDWIFDYFVKLLK